MREWILFVRLALLVAVALGFIDSAIVAFADEAGGY